MRPEWKYPGARLQADGNRGSNHQRFKNQTGAVHSACSLDHLPQSKFNTLKLKLCPGGKRVRRQRFVPKLLVMNVVPGLLDVRTCEVWSRELRVLRDLYAVQNIGCGPRGYACCRRAVGYNLP